MRRIRKNAHVKQLQSLLEQRLSLFHSDACQPHIAALISLVTDEYEQQLQRSAAAEVWHSVPADMQAIAWARQRVANMAIDALAKGKSDAAALREVAQMAALSHRSFRQAYPEYLRDDWQALRTLGVTNSFVAMRSIQLMVDAQLEAELRGDAYLPLYLVDADVLHATPCAVRRAYA